MQYRRLGHAGMKVSVISLGGWINFGEGSVARDLNRTIVEAAYEKGINFFDLADAYGNGEAEKEMGTILNQFPRKTLVVSSKLFWPMSDDVNDRGLSRKHILESIDGTLERLGMDYIDIYFCHRADPETPIYETARAMNDIIEQGKVMYWGTSEWPASKIVEAYEICLRYGWHLPQVEQPNYSMLYRERVESEILPATEPRGIGLVTFSPLAQGMLTGKYDDGVPEDSRLGRQDWARQRLFTDENVERVRALKPIAEDLGLTRAQLALAWNLRQPGVSSVITGATRVSQLEDNVKAAGVNLAEDVVDEIQEILDGD
ncbi:aldo/keto reductase family protein [Phototrophicus methaneseepsis]|uniref:Aldo/keto reductase family protein n=1 Tax=Phototrophicus methaneseepsis TaxID=2710758 RepID=A0A7S8E7U7_9CHLR|nr:aldo/keto reductase family protein [Phototrophicus methaneseepsis]QPC81954.1 aldo/keto reductase family protein [Phototrophicus methaneseepsis]